MKRDTASMSGCLQNYNKTEQGFIHERRTDTYITNICNYCGKIHKSTYCARDGNDVFNDVHDNEFYQTKGHTSGKTQQHRTRRKNGRTVKLFFSIFHLFKRKARGLLLYNGSLAQRKFTLHGLPRWISFLIFFIIMTSSLSTADYYSDYVSVMMRSYNKSACDGEYLRIDCPEATSIHIESAMYGRKVPSSELCPSSETLETGSGSDTEEDTNCEAKTGAECQDKRICQLVVHRRVFGKDPCPGTSKYLTVQYKCAPKDFRQQSMCAEKNIRLRCRQGTIISVFKIQLSNKTICSMNKNYAECTMTKQEIMQDLTKKCHLKEKCSYSLPSASCFNYADIVHTCVPKQFLTSELPSSVELLRTTTSLPTTQTTNYYTTDRSTVKPTVTTLPTEKGDFTTSSTTTSSLYEEDATSANSLNTTAENRTNLADIQVGTSAAKNSSLVVPRKSNGDVDDIIIRNDFPMSPDEDMKMNSTECSGCSSNDLPSSGNSYNTWINLYNYFKENTDSIIIAVLLGVVAALLLTICVLVFPCRKAPSNEKKKTEQDTHFTVADNRQNSTEVYNVTGAPVQEDEHENISLLGSHLQRSISSANNTVQRQHITPNASNIMSGSKVNSKEDRNYCGPKSIFAKICCNCCCNNAPWQRTRILKRGDVYKVTHRNSSSSEGEDETERFHSRDSIPVFRTEDNVDNRSPIPVLEDHVNQTEYPIVMSEPNTSQSHHQNSNFRPISRNANRQYSLTPEPDMTRRTNQSFKPSVRHESQRSDPALNIYSVQQLQNATQPQTAPTSPIINHHGNFPMLNGTHEPAPSRNRMVSTPKSPNMGTSVNQNSQIHNHAYGAAAAPPQTPMTAKYTPPPSLVYNTQQFPSFTNAYEQYDNAQQPVVRRKQFQRPREYNTHNQYSQQQYGTHNGQYAGYYTQNAYGDHFVQAVPRRNIAANAVTIDLAANARTVDLSHNNSLSRNSWLEIRRSSIYDNSLPRNSEMYEYYQKELLAMQQHQQQHDLPGTRNLNQYY